MGKRDYSFLSDRVDRALKSFRIFSRHNNGRASIFVIQLRAPDYWIILACFSESAPTELIFEGTWSKAVDFFSVAPVSFPDPKIIKFPVAENSRALFEIAQETVSQMLIDFPKTLLSGLPSVLFLADGVAIFHESGILRNSKVLYFEEFFVEKKKKKGKVKKPLFEPSNFARKAFYCRFPMVDGSEQPELEFKTAIYRRLGIHDLSLDAQLVRKVYFKGVKILVLGNGFVIVDERHIEKAIEAISAFLAFGFFCGAGCAPANLTDIGSIDVKPDGSSSSWSVVSSTGTCIKFVKKAISAEALDAMVDAFSISINEELALELKLLHLSCFHYASDETLQAFSLAWTVIERRIASLWREKIEEKNYSKSKSDELCESDRYTMSIKIDMLEFTSAINKQEAQRLHAIRKARNKASHEGRIPTKQECEECLRLAIESIARCWSGIRFNLD